MADADITLFTKVCCTCKLELPLESYYKDKRTKDGLYLRCKTCHNKATSAYAKKTRLESNARAKAWRHANKEKVKEIKTRSRLKKLAEDPGLERRRMREYAKKNPEIVKAIAARSRAKRAVTHALETKQYATEYYEQHAELIKARSKERYYQRKEVDRPLVSERVMRRNARKLQATPLWGSSDAIKAIYLRAADITKATGLKHHVDHIVPLQSKHVCGLHVEFNLEVKPWVENVSKSNRWWPDCPDHILEGLPERIRRELEGRS